MKSVEVHDDEDASKHEREAARQERKMEMERSDRDYVESCKTVDEERMLIDMSKLSVTSLKNNPRLIEPRPAMNNEEIKIQAQKQEVVTEAKKVMKQQRGSKDATNLSEKAEEGKKKLMKRVKQKEIIVALSDKLDKLVVSKPETYKEAAKIHID